jgi:hypothetical protein
MRSRAELFLNADHTQGLLGCDVLVTPGMHIKLFIQSMKNNTYARGHSILLVWVSSSGILIGETIQHYATRREECRVLPHKAFICLVNTHSFYMPAYKHMFANTNILREGLASIYCEFEDPGFAVLGGAVSGP